jgi:hypothetical protein
MEGSGMPFRSWATHSGTSRNDIAIPELSSQKSWRKVKQISQTERSQFEKAPHCRTPALWHSGKGKLSRQHNVGEVREVGRQRRHWGLWSYSVQYYNGNDMFFPYTCPNPRTGQPGWTLM